MGVKSLSEELKRHLQIVNYADDISGKKTIEEKFKITFQEQEPEEEETADAGNPEVEDTIDLEAGLDDMDMDMEDPTTPPTPPTPGATPPTPGATVPKPPAGGGVMDPAPSDGASTPPPPTPPTPPTPPVEKDEVEQIDVTDIVNNTEEIGDTVGKFASQLTDIEAKFADLTNKLNSMDMLFQKIDSIEHEIGELKPPTPVEKMELRALDSFPYNQRLDSYFEDKKAQYKKLRGVDLEVEPKEKEYTLTQGEAEEWDPTTIDKSFNPAYDDDNPFGYTGGN
tara:strand:+ start:320 stop:1162 length:843 start_codon:yes stop_codon:yes gene_type:complete